LGLKLPIFYEIRRFVLVIFLEIYLSEYIFTLFDLFSILRIWPFLKLLMAKICLLDYEYMATLFKEEEKNMCGKEEV
jgi:hypothetical protein